MLLLFGLYLLLWLGGIVSISLTGGPVSGAGWASPAFLLMAAAATIAACPREWRAFLAAACIGFGIEVLGVKSGIPFGQYRYSEVLAPSIFGVPVAIAGAWLVLIVFVRQMQTPLRLAAVWMAAIDLIIEPLASGRLNFWFWRGLGVWYGVPYINFIGWYLVSVVILYVAGKPAPRNSIHFYVGLTIQVFFTVLAVVFGLYGAAAVGVALCMLGLARWMILTPQQPVTLSLSE